MTPSATCSRKPRAASPTRTSKADVRVARARRRTVRSKASPRTPAFDTGAPNLVWAERTAAPGAANGADLRYEQKTARPLWRRMPHLDRQRRSACEKSAPPRRSAGDALVPGRPAATRLPSRRPIRCRHIRCRASSPACRSRAARKRSPTRRRRQAQTASAVSQAGFRGSRSASPCLAASGLHAVHAPPQAG